VGQALWKTISELAFRILFPLAAVLLLTAILPIAFQAVALPVAAVGLAFLSGFFFQRDSFYVPPTSWNFPSLLKPPLERVPNAPPPQPLPPLPPDAPRGFQNLGNNCWLNSALQLYESDPFIREWVRAPLVPVANDPRINEEDRHFAEVQARLREFFMESDAAVQRNLPIATGSVQNIRKSLSALNPLILTAANPNENRQEDPDEGIRNHLERLPNEQQIRFRLRFHYKSGEYRDDDEHYEWGIPLAIVGNAPNIEGLITDFCRDEIPDGARDIERKTTEFFEPPPMLRLSLKRFIRQRAPENWLMTLLPFVK
jgi:hypothetical protein